MVNLVSLNSVYRLNYWNPKNIFEKILTDKNYNVLDGKNDDNEAKPLMMILLTDANLRISDRKHRKVEIFENLGSLTGQFGHCCRILNFYEKWADLGLDLPRSTFGDLREGFSTTFLKQWQYLANSMQIFTLQS